MKLSIDHIKPSPEPIRSSMDEDKLLELAQSIKEQGMIVPIKIRPDGFSICDDHDLGFTEGCPICEDVWEQMWGYKNDDWLDEQYPKQAFEIVYGHRRYEACKLAGIDEIDVIVEEPDDNGGIGPFGIYFCALVAYCVIHWVLTLVSQLRFFVVSNTSVHIPFIVIGNMIVCPVTVIDLQLHIETVHHIPKLRIYNQSQIFPVDS